MQEEQPKKKKRFKLFDSQREGKGVTKEQANLPPRLKKFFILYRRDFSRLLSVNMFIVIGNFPIFFLLFPLMGICSVDYATPASYMYLTFSGLLQHEGLSPAMLALNGILGTQNAASTYLPSAFIFFALSALTFFTFGITQVGTTYIVRNMIKGDPVFVWSDFWYAVKRNFKQAFFFGMLDLLLVVLIPANIFIFMQDTGNLLYGIIFWCNIIIGVIYVVMRRYIYLQMVTFDLKLTKILKNALIFSILGIKRNILAFLGIGILLLIIIGCAYSGILLSLAIALPLVMLFSNATYMTTYAAYFVIKKYMIDPYYEEHPEENPDHFVSDEETESGDEPVEA